MEKAMIILRSTKHLEVTLTDSQEEYFQGQRFKKNFFTQKHDWPILNKNYAIPRKNLQTLDGIMLMPNGEACHLELTADTKFSTSRYE